MLATEHRRTPLNVAASIKTVLRAERLARLREELTDDNGQQSLVRLKVAALLALLSRRLDVTESDWQLADYIMGVSDRTRTRMYDALRADAAKAARDRAEARAAFDEHQDDAAVHRTADKILARLSTDPTPASVVRSALGKNLREYIEAAVDSLIRRGLVERLDDEYQGRPRVLLRLRA
nr:hypothetical protein GCM10025730_36050 [Promicromonospora thailandica]